MNLINVKSILSIQVINEEGWFDLGPNINLIDLICASEKLRQPIFLLWCPETWLNVYLPFNLKDTGIIFLNLDICSVISVDDKSLV